MNIVTIEEQTFKQVCGRFSGFVSVAPWLRPGFVGSS